jgi:hypothetical protein
MPNRSKYTEYVISRDNRECDRTWQKWSFANDSCADTRPVRRIPKIWKTDRVFSSESGSVNKGNSMTGSHKSIKISAKRLSKAGTREAVTVALPLKRFA